jgi:hypothetical protein
VARLQPSAKSMFFSMNPGSISYETSMAIIILATPHRYIPIYQG